MILFRIQNYFTTLLLGGLLWLMLLSFTNITLVWCSATLVVGVLLAFILMKICLRVFNFLGFSQTASLRHAEVRHALVSQGLIFITAFAITLALKGG